MNTIAGLTPQANLDSATTKNQNKTKAAAQQFEALMIGQMLKSARSDSDTSSWMGAGEDDQTGQSAMEFAEQQLSGLMAKSGGLGLSKFITEGLNKKL